MSGNNHICVLLLTHEAPASVNRMHDFWARKFPQVDIIIAYGGTEENFSKLDMKSKCYISDTRLRTSDHQREKQSYHGVMRECIALLKDTKHQYVYFTEFDQIPASDELFEYLQKRLIDEDADALLYGLRRVDGTSSAHYLHHIVDPGFISQFAARSVREDKNVVLSAYGFGQFWKKEAFQTVANSNELVPSYLELWIPTVAHHLGYRLRGMEGQDQYNVVYGDFADVFKRLKNNGAWCVHPVKNFWCQ